MTSTNSLRRSRTGCWAPATRAAFAHAKRDIHLDVPWISQFDATQVARAGDFACKRACEAMLDAAGVRARSTALGLRVALREDVERGDGSVVADREQLARAIAYIDRELEAGRPVIAGVSHAPGGFGNRDGITDHWVVIVGRSGGDYLFHDPGTSHACLGRGRFAAAEARDGNLTRAGAIASGPVVDRHFELTIVLRNESRRLRNESQARRR